MRDKRFLTTSTHLETTQTYSHEMQLKEHRQMIRAVCPKPSKKESATCYTLFVSTTSYKSHSLRFERTASVVILAVRGGGSGEKSRVHSIESVRFGEE